MFGARILRIDEKIGGGCSRSLCIGSDVCVGFLRMVERQAVFSLHCRITLPVNSLFFFFTFLTLVWLHVVYSINKRLFV